MEKLFIIMMLLKYLRNYRLEIIVINKQESHLNTINSSYKIKKWYKKTKVIL